MLLVERLYDLTWRRVRHLGGVVLLTRSALARMVTPPFAVGEVVRQIESMGVRSTSLAATIALFSGAVLALQTAFTLERFGAELFIAEMVGLALVRELGPVLTALMVGGRVGAGITAELGTMNVSEQIDAMRSLGADPVRKLVSPRVWALVIGLPLLTMLADTTGVFGGMLVAMWELDLEPGFFMQRLLRRLEYGDLFSGLAKSVFFAVAIGVIAAYNGLRARGGADGVGRATTDTVVAIAITVLVIDFFLTKAFLLL